MLRWEQEIINSKDLIIVNPEDLDLEKFNLLFNKVIEEYSLYKSEISELMLNGLKKFYYDCKGSLEKKEKIVLRYEVYCRMLRWIITRNNPRYLAVKFDEFRKAIKELWIFLFGEYFHEFRYPTEKKTYIDDKEVWLEWFECIEGKLKE